MSEEQLQNNQNEKPSNEFSLTEFSKLYGEDLSHAIDIDTWHIGDDLAELHPLIEQELIKAKQEEISNHSIIRETIFPKIKDKGLVSHSGLHDVNSYDLIEKIQRGFLFNKAVTASASVSAAYNSVPISIIQIGVCLVNYQEQHGSYSHRLFRKDLKSKNDDPIKEVLSLLENRKGNDSDKKKISDIAIRGIKSFAERTILLEKSGSNWIMGKGSPVPNELMMGFWSSQVEMKNKSISLMRKMILEHERFVYIQNSKAHPQLWTLGNALRPFEYLIINSIEDNLMNRLDSGGIRGDFLKDYTDFVTEVGPKIAMGVFKVSTYSQPHIFYGHVDHIRTAALIAMADSAFQLHTGTPMLLDLADSLCKTAFGKNDFIASIEQASIKNDIITQQLKGNG